VIHLCNAIISGHGECQRLAGDDGEYASANQPAIFNIAAAGRAGIAQVAQIAAMTAHGLRAKATVLLLVPDDDLAASLAKDVLAGSV